MERRNTQGSEFYSLTDVAEKLGREPNTVVRWHEAGQFPKGKKIGKLYFWRKLVIDEFLYGEKRSNTVYEYSGKGTEFYSLADLSRKIGVQKNTILKWEKSGQFPKVMKIGHSYFWKKSIIDEFLYDDKI